MTDLSRETVSRMIAYLEAHAMECAPMEALSRAVGYSEKHCARLFREATGVSPTQYQRRYRIFLAARELRHSRRGVLPIALDFGYQSHEGFTRAFSDQFGVPPLAYRKRFIEITRTPEPVKRKGDAKMANIVYVQVVERPARRMILKRAKTATEYFEYCDEIGCDIWDEFLKIPGALYEPVGMWLPDAFRPLGTSLYAQGVEVPAGYDGPVPEGMEVIDLPACKMMIFQGQPYRTDTMEAMEAAIETVQTAKEEYAIGDYGWEWAPNDAPRIQCAPEPAKGYIEGWPVRAVRR